MPVAIVTGASRGIGKAISLRLADDGIDVAINDLPSQSTELEQLKAEIEQKGRKSVCVMGDVSKEEDVMEMVATTFRGLGELDIMVANAGIVIPRKLFEQTIDEWDRVMSINAKGMFMCYREAGRQMIRQGRGGKIIGACSSAGHRPTVTGVAYSASKWAVRGITQVTALELAQYGITVNAYCPGPVETDMWAEIDASIAKRDGVPVGSTYEQAVQNRMALKQRVTVEDVASLVSFLAGPGSRNITGQSLLVDGGQYFT
jgi:meso-butanediol dehydrogenase / (S,S)-butanediol dehydrogenase / diacetyl reductase